MTELRKHSRKQTDNYFIVYNRVDGSLVGRLRNLTPEGAMVISDGEVAVPTVVKVRMQLPDVIEGCREIRMDMESKWCQENKRANWFETGYTFVGFTGPAQAVIEALVRDWVKIS
jgi:hypothetical protein